MSAAHAPSWPGSRVLLAWWRELAGRQPRQLRLSRLVVHRIEALVRTRRSHELDRWQRALLHLAGTRVPCGGEWPNTFADLQMDAQVLQRLMGHLTDAGLLHRNGAGLWQMTAAGQRALETGKLSVAAEERRTFLFVDHSPLGLPPHFLPLSAIRSSPSAIRSPLSADEQKGIAESGKRIAESGLQACIQQTPQWKARYRFPSDVEALLPPGGDETLAEIGRRVILDAVTEQWLVLIDVPSKSGVATLQGFAVCPDGWTLEPEPLLTLADGWQEALPDAATEPTAESWRQAWQAWAHPRSLPQSEVEACRLERVDHRLIVRVPPRLLDRLRAARSDAVKQEAWLLAGAGRTRFAAQIELHVL
jgi:hypothetical protein